jgi:hypothetical protein
MKIAHMIAIVAACGFMSVAAAQAGTNTQTAVKGPQAETGRSAYRNHHPAVVMHRHARRHHLMYSQPHLHHHHHPVVR